MSAASYPIDWRHLLTSIGIEWRDRGPNTRRGNVNVRCPFCAADPSFHLAISEEIEAYVCYRDSRHAGRSFGRLLHALGVQREEQVRLLNSNLGRIRERAAAAPIRSQGRTDRLWAGFDPAHDAVADYLRDQRGFPNPRQTIERYDLRSVIEGRWARRLLLPFRDHEGKMITWAGRAIDARSPKYLMESYGDGAAVYCPRRTRGVVVLCEGPLDALKIAAATEDEDISAIATAGKNLNSAKLLTLRSMCAGRIVMFAPDGDVSIGERNRLRSELAGSLDARYLGTLAVPSDYKDPAEIPLPLITPWIKEKLSATPPDQT
jgi:hypothetical protein